MDDALRRHAGTLARALAFGTALALIGCGGGPKTGDLIEEAPGQADGEQASMEEMERLMKEGKLQ